MLGILLAAAATFQGLGDLPGGEVHSEALAISANGKVVAGRSSSDPSPEEGFVWTARDGMKPLLGPGGVHVGGEPRAVDASGKVITYIDEVEGGGGDARVKWVIRIESRDRTLTQMFDVRGDGRDEKVMEILGTRAN